jgi:hypothetical protein
MDGAVIGCMVHFRTTSEECRAALVVGVWNPKLGVVDLSVFLDGPHDGAKPEQAPLRWVGEVGGKLDGLPDADAAQAGVERAGRRVCLSRAARRTTEPVLRLVPGTALGVARPGLRAA